MPSHMSLPLTEELTRQTIETITEVRRDPGDRDNAAAVIDLVLRLTDAGLHEYSVRSLEQAKAGMMALGTAKIGTTTDASRDSAGLLRFYHRAAA